VRVGLPFQSDGLGFAPNAQEDVLLGLESTADALDTGDPDLIRVERPNLGFGPGEEGGGVGDRRLGRPSLAVRRDRPSGDAVSMWLRLRGWRGGANGLAEPSITPPSGR